MVWYFYNVFLIRRSVCVHFLPLFLDSNFCSFLITFFFAHLVRSWFSIALLFGVYFFAYLMEKEFLYYYCVMLLLLHFIIIVIIIYTILNFFFLLQLFVFRHCVSTACARQFVFFCWFCSLFFPLPCLQLRLLFYFYNDYFVLL